MHQAAFGRAKRVAKVCRGIGCHYLNHFSVLMELGWEDGDEYVFRACMAFQAPSSRRYRDDDVHHIHEYDLLCHEKEGYGRDCIGVSERVQPF